MPLSTTDFETNTPRAISRRSSDSSNSLAASIALRAGLDWTQVPVGNIRDEHERRRAQERAADAADAAPCRSLVDVCERALRLEGYNVPRSDEDLIRSAVSTATLQHAFTDSINAIVSSAFDDAPDTTGWCEEVEVSSFKEQTDITLTPSRGMTKIGRGGTAPHVTLGDRGEAFKIARYAEQFILDEMDIIDDRFDLLTTVPDLMAQEAARLRPDLVYSLLLANPTLGEDAKAVFHADHGNLAGSGSALAAAALQTALTAMGSQRDNNVPLNIRGRHLIVPPDLTFTGRQLVSSAEVRGDGAANGTRNPLQDESLQVVAEDRIGTSGVTSPDTGITYTGSSTNWFLAGSRRTIGVAFLRGTNRRPIVRQSSLQQGRWGLAADVKFDIAAYARDFRGLYKATGEAA
ncbi:MAG: Mu-like prophage major head subunit gpT family protein [Planctomycetota bacterium]